MPKATAPRGNTLPYSEDAEKGVIASMLLAPEIVSAEAAALLTAEAFYHPAHATIYALILEMIHERAPVTFISLKWWLASRNQLDEIGGKEFLNELYTFVPTASNARYYIDIVLDCFYRRTCTLEFTRLISLVNESHVERYEEIAQEVEAVLFKLATKRVNKEINLKEEAYAVLEEIEAAKENKGISGLLFGIPSLDRELGGVQPSETVVIAAETSGGKTALALQLLEQTSIVRGLHGVMFSLEMPIRALLRRVYASRARVSLRSMKRGTLSEDDYRRLTGAYEQICGSQIHLENDYSMNALQIVSRCRQLKTKYNLSLAIIDYLQLMETIRREENRAREVATMSRTIKVAANELGLPFVVLSQTNDEGLLAESRSIGKDSDIILRIETPKNAKAFERVIVIAKHRNDERGYRIPVKFYAHQMRFEDNPSPIKAQDAI